MPTPTPVDAPIVAVTVYPTQARVIRRLTVPLEVGTHELDVGGLPTTLIDASVRVTGRGDAARIVGVDVARRFLPGAPDERITALESALERLRERERELADDDATQAARADFLAALARRGGRALADALASGEAGSERVASFAATLTAQLAETQARRRQIAGGRRDLAREIEAKAAELDGLREQRRTERRSVLVAVEAGAATTIELDIAYLVGEASWRPVYDARLDGNRVVLDWHGLVEQRSGEDWPAVDLALSTARPAAAAAVPELRPWFVDAWTPVPQSGAVRVVAAPSASPQAQAGSDAGAVDAAALRAPLPVPEATLEQGVAASTYRLPRPVAVPSDGSPHKATIATVELPADLDHVTVPKLAEEAYLRATVTNDSPHTFLPGRVSVFHGTDFVGATHLEVVAPGEEIELQLGLDDRLRVTRELVQRETSKAVLGNTKRTAVTYEITVESHLPEATKLTVHDQFPVSRHESIRIRDQHAAPEPSARTDLEIVTWHLELAPGEVTHLRLSFQLEHPRDLRVAGWQD